MAAGMSGKKKKRRLSYATGNEVRGCIEEISPGEELLSMSDKPEELTAIVKKSAMNGWKSFYPLKKARTRKTEAKGSKNRFNNFPQREYDFEEYEKQLLMHGAGAEEK